MLLINHSLTKGHVDFGITWRYKADFFQWCVLFVFSRLNCFHLNTKNQLTFENAESTFFCLKKTIGWERNAILIFIPTRVFNWHLSILLRDFIHSLLESNSILHFGLFFHITASMKSPHCWLNNFEFTFCHFQLHMHTTNMFFVSWDSWWKEWKEINVNVILYQLVN